jgi:hypothetical protein
MQKKYRSAPESVIRVIFEAGLPQDSRTGKKAEQGLLSTIL